MSASSSNALDGIGAGQIIALLDILRQSNWRKRSFVEQQYGERAPNFAATLAFLETLGWVRADGDELVLVDTSTAGESKTPALLDRLLGAPGRHQREFARYLSRFGCVGDNLSYVAQGEQSLVERQARDFLMELGAVHFDPVAKIYVLESPFIGAYLWALAEAGPETAAEIVSAGEERQALGFAAEVAVVEFERERLGSRWADQVRHVAAERPAAPYDISSFTLQGVNAARRYIEVKAVSPVDFEFHWSTREIEVARLLGPSLYLYLAPVRGPNDFDLARMQIIPNPFTVVYSHPTAWDKRPTNFVCRPARETTSRSPQPA